MVDSSCAGDLAGLSVCGTRRRCIGGGATALRGCRLRRRVEDAGAPAACRRGHSRHSCRRAAAAAVPGCPRAARGCGGRNDRHRAGGSPLRAGCVNGTAPRARCVQGREGPASAGDCQSPVRAGAAGVRRCRLRERKRGIRTRALDCGAIRRAERRRGVAGCRRAGRWLQDAQRQGGCGAASGSCGRAPGGGRGGSASAAPHL